MENKKYEKGISMTFPLELTEIKMKHIAKDNRYLCPYEVKELQRTIEDACDHMEYDGSLMYDAYPDKVSVELLASRIAKKSKCKRQSEISNRFYQVLIQTMLCNEMSYRRERRSCHKRNMGKPCDYL